MKNLLITLGFIISMNSCFAQNSEENVAMIFEARAKYIEDSIPDKFLFHYSPFIEMNHNQIIDSLILNLSELETNIKNIYLMEFIPDDYRSKIHGVFWTDSMVISYKWNELKSQIELLPGEYLNMAKPFIKDVKEWNDNVTDRSYRWTSIAGAWYAFCSKVRVENGKIFIDNDVFRVYNKDHFEIYLKEKPFDDYKYKLVEPPR